MSSIVLLAIGAAGGIVLASLVAGVASFVRKYKEKYL